ncbi:MAG: ATP-binding protein [bacterium]|nr:ATP-binding protein [bacterium]
MSSNAPTDSVCLTVPSHARYLGLVRKVIQQVSQEGGFTEDEGRKLILAVDEACSNIIKHSYDNDPTKTISLTLTDSAEKLEIRIQDFGKRPDVDRIRPRDLDEVRPGGLGTHFIRSIMDEVTYDTSPGVGCILHLVKYKSPQVRHKHK